MNKSLPVMSNVRNSWSQTKNVDGEERTVRVRQVENGYVICISKYSKDDWEEKEYISTKNPLEGLNPVQSGPPKIDKEAIEALEKVL